MIVSLEPGTDLPEKAAIITALHAAGLRASLDFCDDTERIVAPGSRPDLEPMLLALPGVREVANDTSGYALVSRVGPYSRGGPRATDCVHVGPTTVGGEDVVLCAGPCAVESREQIFAAAEAVEEGGALILRGGAFKPRTSPYSFQGLGEEGLVLLREAGDAVGLPVVTEVIAPESVELVARYADMLQVGARSMQNFALLRAVGETRLPVLLKRGMMATIEELLLAAEYVVSAGNTRVILCERGIRSFDRATRNTFDVSAIPLLKRETHLPVIADPSHGCGRRDLVPAVALAAIAAGADGLIVEVHPDPANALSDGAQSLNPTEFAALADTVERVACAVGRGLAGRPQALSSLLE